MPALPWQQLDADPLEVASSRRGTDAGRNHKTRNCCGPTSVLEWSPAIAPNDQVPTRDKHAECL